MECELIRQFVEGTFATTAFLETESYSFTELILEHVAARLDVVKSSRNGKGGELINLNRLRNKYIRD